MTKVIGGNFRYLLVVLIGVYLSRVKKEDELKLPRSKVIIAIIITFGVIMFTLFKDVLIRIKIGWTKEGSCVQPRHLVDRLPLYLCFHRFRFFFY